MFALYPTHNHFYCVICTLFALNPQNCTLVCALVISSHPSTSVVKVSAYDIAGDKAFGYDKSYPLAVVDIDNAFIASEVKEILSRVVGEECKIIFINGEKQIEICARVSCFIFFSIKYLYVLVSAVFTTTTSAPSIASAPLKDKSPFCTPKPTTFIINPHFFFEIFC